MVSPNTMLGSDARLDAPGVAGRGAGGARGGAGGVRLARRAGNAGHALELVLAALLGRGGFGHGAFLLLRGLLLLLVEFGLLALRLVLLALLFLALGLFLALLVLAFRLLDGDLRVGHLLHRLDLGRRRRRFHLLRLGRGRRFRFDRPRRSDLRHRGPQFGLDTGGVAGAPVDAEGQRHEQQRVHQQREPEPAAQAVGVARDQRVTGERGGGHRSISPRRSSPTGPRAARRSAAACPSP